MFEPSFSIGPQVHRFPQEAGAVRALRELFGRAQEAQRADHVDRMGRTRALIERSRRLLEASAPAPAIVDSGVTAPPPILAPPILAPPILAPLGPPKSPPVRFSSPDVPYFGPAALRRLAAQARRFAEVLPPEDRRLLIARAARLERDAARRESD